MSKKEDANCAVTERLCIARMQAMVNSIKMTVAVSTVLILGFTFIITVILYFR